MKYEGSIYTVSQQTLQIALDEYDRSYPSSAIEDFIKDIQQQTLQQVMDNIHLAETLGMKEISVEGMLKILRDMKMG